MGPELSIRVSPTCITVGCMLLFAHGAWAQPPTYVWAKMLPGNVESVQRGTAVDVSGNVYLFGNFWGTVDFDPNAGTVNLTPPTYGTSVYIAKYDPNGAYLWAKYIPLTTYAGAMAIDAAANIYICGYYQGTNIDFDPGAGTAYLSSNAGSNDIYLAKYDANGNYVWAKSLGTAGSEAANDLQVDAAGNLIVVGNFSGTLDFDPAAGVTNRTAVGGVDGFLAKYDGNGNLIWADAMGSTGAEDFREVYVNSTGICLTGSYSATADLDPGSGTANLTAVGNADALLAKYDANGNYVWAKSLSGAGNDMGVSLVMDAAGNVFCTGSINSGGLVQVGSIDMDPGAGIAVLTPPNWASQTFLARMDANGNYVWAKLLPLNAADIDVRLDVYGRVFIAGDYYTGTSPIDMDPGAGVANLAVVGGGFTPLYNHVLARFDGAGIYQWAGVFGHSCWCNVSGYKASLCTAPNGTLYFTGIMQAGYASGTVDFDPSTGVANITAPSQVDNTFFAKYSDLIGPLPVEWLDFTGTCSNGTTHLFWSTATEADNDHFTVERTSDGGSFEPIGEVRGAGNAQQAHAYRFDDPAPLPGVNYYRIEQVDLDGASKYSDIIAVENNCGIGTCRVRTAGDGLFYLACPVGASAYAEVLTADGRAITRMRLRAEEELRVDLHDRDAGTYVLRIVDGERVQAYKLVR